MASKNIAIIVAQPGNCKPIKAVFRLNVFWRITLHEILTSWNLVWLTRNESNSLEAELRVKCFVYTSNVNKEVVTTTKRQPNKMFKHIKQFVDNSRRTVTVYLTILRGWRLKS